MKCKSHFFDAASGLIESEICRTFTTSVLGKIYKNLQLGHGTKNLDVPEYTYE